MLSILLLVPMFELLGLLGFMFLASISVEPGLRYLPLVAAAVTVVLLFAREIGSMTFRQLVMSAVLLSFLVVAAFQVLGFFFSGLAKDVDLISFANVTRLAVIFAIAIIAHGSVLAVCYVLYRR